MNASYPFLNASIKKFGVVVGIGVGFSLFLYIDPDSDTDLDPDRVTAASRIDYFADLANWGFLFSRNAVTPSLQSAAQEISPAPT